MKIPIYQIDAFANQPFKGNPAMVCPLENWLPDNKLQAIAEENNIAVTAFIVPSDEGYCIRWFTPIIEEDICGHATLAAAYMLFEIANHEGDEIRFDSRAGVLIVNKAGSDLVMKLPALIPKVCELPDTVRRAFDITPVECLKAEDYILVFNSEKEIGSANPNYELLKDIDLRGVVITALSSNYDFVARFFTPKFGIPEDAATGSAYAQIAPYWASKVGAKKFKVKQLSPRGGELKCEVINDRVWIYGKAVKYLEGEIEV